MEVLPAVVAVDDEPVILSLIVSILKGHYRVFPFSSGTAALRAIADKGADLILLDAHMPEMDGFDILKTLRDDPVTQGIPVIFLTGSGDDGTEASALEQGAADYIRKPVKPAVLLQRIRTHLELFGYRRRLEKMVEEKTGELRQAVTKLRRREDSILSLLARVTEQRDCETGLHIERTTRFTEILVNDLLANPSPEHPLNAVQAEAVIRTAKLHDLGKISVPDSILRKTGKLTKAEFVVIREHPRVGAELIQSAAGEPDDSFFSTAYDIALYHHEKWDGTGYPDGLSGFAIPLSARIVALADVYDALISPRPYKAPMDHETAAEIIISNSGGHFDPYLVGIFERKQQDFLEAFKSTLGMRECYAD